MSSMLSYQLLAARERHHGERPARDESQAAQDLMKAGYRPTAQRGHIERPHGVETITTERVWTAMREALAQR
jgi:hypothetical protein